MKDGSASPENASPARTDGKQIAEGAGKYQAAKLQLASQRVEDNALHLGSHAFYPSLYEEDVQFRQSHPRPREIGDL